MSNYNKGLAKQRILEFCRFPVPRSRSEISNYLKLSVPGFYPKSNSHRVSLFIEDLIQDLANSGLIVDYTPNDSTWKNTRKLVSHYFNQNKRHSPRKLSKLYQTNIFCLAGSQYFSILPVIKDINLDLVALWYNFTKDKETEPQFENFFMQMLNLAYCCSFPEIKSKFRIEIYQLDFTERERGLLERIFDYSEKITSKFNIPFSPNAAAALEFLRML